MVEHKFDPGFRVIGEYFSQLTQYYESQLLNITSQFDSILRVNLTQYYESI